MDAMSVARKVVLMAKMMVASMAEKKVARKVVSMAKMMVASMAASTDEYKAALLTA